MPGVTQEEKRILRALRSQDGMDQSAVMAFITPEEKTALKRLINRGEVAVTLDWNYVPTREAPA